jgi:DUF917 family protein
LIAVLDAQSGSALGTPEYRYGLRVIVLGTTAAPQWTSTKRALDLGGLQAFGFEGERYKYRPLGQWNKPQSVVEEYNEAA